MKDCCNVAYTVEMFYNIILYFFFLYSCSIMKDCCSVAYTVEMLYNIIFVFFLSVQL